MSEPLDPTAEVCSFQTWTGLSGWEGLTLIPGRAGGQVTLKGGEDPKLVKLLRKVLSRKVQRQNDSAETDSEKGSDSCKGFLLVLLKEPASNPNRKASVHGWKASCWCFLAPPLQM